MRERSPCPAGHRDGHDGGHHDHGDRPGRKGTAAVHRPATAHVLAHGLGGRTDLPMDGLTAIAGGGTAIAASFLALTVAWREPRLFPDGGCPLPARLARALESRALTRAGRTVA